MESSNPVVRSAPFSILEKLVENETPESSLLELKQDLPLKDGAAGWRARSRIHASERDGLAKEIVALANAYGGEIFVGIAESNDFPKRAIAIAEPLPNIEELADRLRTALASVISPPIVGLSIRAIKPDLQDTSGYLLIDVPASIQAPHGFGSPTAAYVRRDDRSEPATMHDLQSLFWESRTNRERVETERSRALSWLADHSPRKNCVTYCLYAIPEVTLNMPRLAADLRGQKIFGIPNSIRTYSLAPAADLPSNNHSWRPTYFGADYKFGRREDNRSGTWQIHQNGTLLVQGDCEVFIPQQTNERQFPPVWALKSLGHIIGISKLISKYSEYGGNWIVGAGFRSDFTVTAVNSERIIFRGGQDFIGRAEVRPILFAAEQIDDAAEQLADQVWATFHMLDQSNEALLHGLEEIEQFDVAL